TSRQIQYAIKNLESKKILITGNYNKLGIDRTKWYSIDYNVLSEFCPFDNFVQSLNNFVQPSDNIVQPIDTIVQPLPETTTENTSETTTDIYTPLFDFWNNQKIVTHRKLNDDLRRKIKKALSEYSLEEIKTA